MWHEEESLPGHTDWVRDVAWAPNLGLPKSTIASAGQDGQVRPAWTYNLSRLFHHMLHASHISMVQHACKTGLLCIAIRMSAWLREGFQHTMPIPRLSVSWSSLHGQGWSHV